MICLAGNLPALKIAHHHVVGYDTDWIEEALQRAARACNRTDCPFLDDISKGILHYLEKRCSLRVFDIEALFERMRMMLERIGCHDIARNLSPLAPPVTVSLIGPARKAGAHGQSCFFRLLRNEMTLLQQSGAEAIHFCDINESVRMLLGDASEGARDCLKLEISSFLKSYQQLNSKPELELSVTLES